MRANPPLLVIAPAHVTRDSAYFTSFSRRPLITFVHFAESAAIRVAKSWGELPTGVRPVVMKRSRKSGAATACEVPCCSFAMMLFCVPAGA